MADLASPRNRLARELFAPLAPRYDRCAALLSFRQDPYWRRFLVSRVGAGADNTVLDVATGTAAVAIELARTRGCSVVGVDQSPEMLAGARARVAASGVGERVRLLRARAEQLPFEDATFGAVTFTYLLRYVDDPAATIKELARVVRPGGMVASLEFGLPAGVWRPLWESYVRVGLPLAGRLIGRGWEEVGRFLGPSIRDFYARYPLPRQHAWWGEAGIEDVRSRALSLGGAVVTWGRRR